MQTCQAFVADLDHRVMPSDGCRFFEIFQSWIRDGSAKKYTKNMMEISWAEKNEWGYNGYNDQL
jgi:hypothetical protein